MLQCVAVCCSVLLRVLFTRGSTLSPTIYLSDSVTHCNTLQHIAAACNTLQRSATPCDILLQHTTTHRHTLQNSATRCNTLLQHAATRSNARQHSATRCNTPTTRTTALQACVLQRVAACCSIFEECCRFCVRRRSGIFIYKNVPWGQDHVLRCLAVC